MTEYDAFSYSTALKDFKQARRQAVLQEMLARLTGRSTELLPYEEVRRKLKVTEGGVRQLKDIPLDGIVGSVGRYSDFTRDFLPRRDSDEERWARVMATAHTLTGLPPIEVYQIDNAYFVKDGNHRVSVARQLGASHIEAYVTPVQTKVPLSPDTQPDDLILKAEYVDFLERTNLGELRPEADLEVTVPGQYQLLLEHIEVHRHFMGIEQQREIPYEEAVAHWYDVYYLPVVQVIRARGLLRDFPGRTETDLYLWTLEHRAALAEELGWEIGPGPAAGDLAAQSSPKAQRLVGRVGKRIRDVVTPDGLEAGPPPGQWRKERQSARPDDCLFADILVAVDGRESGWYALDGATAIARCEEARLHGLHVVAAETEKDSEQVRAVQIEFDRRCQAVGLRGKLVLEVGKVARVITERARLTDLVVLSLSHPYPSQPLARLSSGLRHILSRSPTPVLVMPGPVSRLDRVLLAYDGSLKSEEALFVTTYLAGQWRIPPVVVTVFENSRPPLETLEHAQGYLESHGIGGAFVRKDGPVAEGILETAEEHHADLIIMGGYRSGPLLEIALGSTVGALLRTCRRPILVCQ